MPTTIGYEHGFTNEAYDILRVCGGRGADCAGFPILRNAYQTQRRAGRPRMISAEQRRPVKLEKWCRNREAKGCFFPAGRRRPLCGSLSVRRATRASWAEGLCL